ncbi:MAG: AAA family ATPase [Bacteroidales bacterium]|nr:AAA family ATPase [Bacteroidales bacterium]
MNHTNMDLLADALEVMGGECVIAEAPKCLLPDEQEQYLTLMKQLDAWQVHRDDRFDDNRYLLDYGGIRCFPRGDVIAISGREKSGKTTSCRMIAAAVLAGQYLNFRAREEQLRVLWIDTEQYRADSLKILRSLELMCGRELTDNEFRLVSLRGQDIMADSALMKLSLTLMFNEYLPDLVIIDGIRDYISDFNDVVQSTEIVLHCMALSNGVSADEALLKGLRARKPSCVLCNLHLNKPKDDNNMMGHLGSALAKKAGEIYNCTKDPDTRIFSITQTASRGRPWEQDFNYRVRTELVDNRIEVSIPEMMNQVAVQTAFVETKAKNTRRVTVKNYSQGAFGKAPYASANEFRQLNDLGEAFRLIIPEGMGVRSGELGDEFRQKFLVSVSDYGQLLSAAQKEQILYRFSVGTRQVTYFRYEDRELAQEQMLEETSLFAGGGEPEEENP